MVDRFYLEINKRHSAHLIGAFDSLEKPATRNRIARKANTKAIRPMTQAAKRNLRGIAKQVSKAVTSITKTYKRGGVVVSVVGGDVRKLKDENGKDYPTNVLSLIEYGTQPHIIKVKNKKTLGLPPTEQDIADNLFTIFGAEVEHPGARPQPFLRPAFDSTKSQSLAIHERVMGEEIVKEFNKGKPA